ncbi:hypothetical protein PAXRUDRAFT_834103 [Paxillus rubicundulus Ve08.2h10]|uniref:Uncharacterized protein n=1 Tax=Paxillus rubicundulus Ve08.2h10 TaxID=930991 RepID=A0A0D0DM36_9AGAM|nr:hypothetical protein PAXRUDRAFT_834103 [Paxillus rubicundulus Ve08.2h10]
MASEVSIVVVVAKDFRVPSLVQARSFTVPRAYGDQVAEVDFTGASSTVCMNTHKGINTQRSDDGEEG